VSALTELLERRAYECRLTPDRALQSLGEAEEFLRDRGMLTRTTDSALPSLFEACHEEPYAPGTPGFGQWPRTKYPWSFALNEREDVLAVKVHRGKTVYVTAQVAAILDPICRAELSRMEQEHEGWARLLSHLAAAGPSTVEDLRVELGLKGSELRRLRAPLERCGAIVSTGLVLERETGHIHTSELARWDQVYPEPADGDAGLGELLVAGVRAAVVTPERELGGWFSWSWRFSNELVEELVREGRIARPEPGWITAAEMPSR
jgi:hypothetical protein